MLDNDDIDQIDYYLNMAEIFLDLYGKNSLSALWYVRLAANERKNKHPFKGTIREWIKELKRG